MKYIFLIILPTLITDNTNGLKIVGLYANVTDILNMIAAKGSKRIPNFLPDLTSNDNTRKRQPGYDAARRYLISYIDELKKKALDESKEFVSDDFTDYDEISPTKPKRIGAIGELALRTINKDFTELKEERIKKAKRNRLKAEHENNIAEVTAFMKPNYYTTMYLLREVKRIKEQRAVLDPLRKMVRYVENPKRTRLKKELLNCFEKLRKKYSPGPDLWNKLQTNNLVINTIKDPNNYGFIN